MPFTSKHDGMVVLQFEYDNEICMSSNVESWKSVVENNKSSMFANISNCENKKSRRRGKPTENKLWAFEKLCLHEIKRGPGRWEGWFPIRLQREWPWPPPTSAKVCMFLKPLDWSPSYAFSPSTVAADWCLLFSFPPHHPIHHTSICCFLLNHVHIICLSFWPKVPHAELLTHLQAPFPPVLLHLSRPADPHVWIWICLQGVWNLSIRWRSKTHQGRISSQSSTHNRDPRPRPTI